MWSFHKCLSEITGETGESQGTLTVEMMAILPTNKQRHHIMAGGGGSRQIFLKRIFNFDTLGVITKYFTNKPSFMT